MSKTAPGTLAVVTGAGSPTGIGFAIARSLAAAGHAVLVTSTTERGFVTSRRYSRWATQNVSALSLPT